MASINLLMRRLQMNTKKSWRMLRKFRNNKNLEVEVKHKERSFFKSHLLSKKGQLCKLRSKKIGWCWILKVIVGGYFWADFGWFLVMTIWCIIVLMLLNWVTFYSCFHLANGVPYILSFKYGRSWRELWIYPVTSKYLGQKPLTLSQQTLRSYSPYP